MREHLDDFRRFLSARNHAPRTQATYARIVETFFAFRDLPVKTEPSLADVEAFLVRPKQTGAARAPRARNLDLAALRVFFRFAAEHGLLSRDPTKGIRLLREPAHEPAVPTLGEIRAMFSAAAQEPDPVARSRSIALLAVLSQTALRVHEVAGLTVSQLEPVSASLLDVHGKGATRHSVALNPDALALLTAWVEARGAIAKAGETALFVGLQTGTRLSVRAVQHVIAVLRGKAGITRKVSPHSFRHAAATHMLTAGADVAVVAGALRHASVTTTMQYLHLVDTHRRRAIATLAAAIPPELRASSAEAPVPPTREQAVTFRPERPCVEGNLDEAA
jgi:integrase/recombinase XerC